MPTTYDVAVLGGQAAGFAAAGTLAKANRSVIVLDAPPASLARCPLTDWIPRDLFKHPAVVRSVQRDSGAVSFSRVEFHDRALERRASFNSRSDLGYFLPAGGLDNALASWAKDRGATIRSAKDPAEIQLHESGIELRASRSVHARMLLIAQDHPHAIIPQIGRPTRMPNAATMQAIALDIPLPGRRDALDPPEAMHIIEMAERSEIGMMMQVGRTLHVRVISTSRAAGLRTSEMTELLTRLGQAKLIPSDLPLDRATGAAWSPPAGMALDQEVHLAKRCLLAASAGGFADSITGQSLYPAIVSAVLAAQTIHQALDADTPQDVLPQYKDAWRKDLGDYLRPPNTSLAMLLPLLFVNQRVVGRFSRALLLGEAI
jgi:flavin-dependent dehydrogenase